MQVTFSFWQSSSSPLWRGRRNTALPLSYAWCCSLGMAGQRRPASTVHTVPCTCYSHCVFKDHFASHEWFSYISMFLPRGSWSADFPGMVCDKWNQTSALKKRIVPDLHSGRAKGPAELWRWNRNNIQKCYKSGCLQLTLDGSYFVFWCWVALSSNGKFWSLWLGATVFRFTFHTSKGFSCR